MSNVSIDPSSQSGPTPGNNGSAEVESENVQPNYPTRKYKLEDFSQQAINRGQQEINYLITETGEKIVVALNELRLVVTRLAAPGYNWSALDKAIDDVAAANLRIAGQFPPGCLKPQSEE
jgi:hypothetical protein